MNFTFACLELYYIKSEKAILNKDLRQFTDTGKRKQKESNCYIQDRKKDVIALFKIKYG